MNFVKKRVKTCNWCGLPKPVAEFFERKTGGYSSVCRACNPPYCLYNSYLRKQKAGRLAGVIIRLERQICWARRALEKLEEKLKLAKLARERSSLPAPPPHPNLTHSHG